MILFGNSSIICFGIFHKNPANTIREGRNAFSSSKTSVVNAERLNTRVAIPRLATRSITPALGLLQYTFCTEISGTASKYVIILAAFVPDPEAKTRTFFKINYTFYKITHTYETKWCSCKISR